MSNSNGGPVHGRAAWNSYASRQEKQCPVCGKPFMATPFHRYRIADRWMCSYTCLRRMQNRSFRPVSGETMHKREEILAQIVEKTHWMIAAKTPDERRAASSARNKWLQKLEEVERYGGETADEAGEQA